MLTLAQAREFIGPLGTITDDWWLESPYWPRRPIDPANEYDLELLRNDLIEAFHDRQKIAIRCLTEPPPVWTISPHPWKWDSYGWLDDANGKPILEYAGCGSHSCQVNSEGDKRLIEAAPFMLGLLELAAKDLPEGNLRRDILAYTKVLRDPTGPASS